MIARLFQSVPGRLSRRATARLAVVGEAGLEFLAGEEDAALHGAEGEVHVVGDFLILVAGNVHRGGDAVLVGEAVDSGLDLSSAEAVFGRLDARVLAEVEVVEVVGGVDNSGSAHTAAVVVDEEVAHDGEDPALEVCTFGVFVFVVERLEGGVLKEIVSIIAVGGEHVCEVEHVALEVHQVALESCGCHIF